MAGTAERPRLVVTRSARHLFVQIVDDCSGRTLVSASTFKLGRRQDGAGPRSGQALADAAKAAGISRVVFDRAGNTYTGRVAAFAEAAREGGLEF